MAAAQPRRHLHHPRPVRRQHDLHVGRARRRSRAPRPPRPPSAAAAASSRAGREDVRARATPGASSKCIAVGDRDDVVPAVDREAVHGHLRAGHELLVEHAPAARAAPRPAGGRGRRPSRVARRSLIARWPWRSAALTTAGIRRAAPVSDQAGWGTPAAARALALRELVGRQLGAVARSSGCGRSSSSARPRRPPAPASRCPARSGRAAPPRAPSAARRSTSSLETATSPRAGSASQTTVRTPSALRRVDRVALRGPAAEDDEVGASDRLRGLSRRPGPPATMPGCPGTSAIVRSRPSSNGDARAPAEQLGRLVGRADVAVDLARPVGDVVLEARRACPARSRIMSAICSTDSSTPVATLIVSPTIALERHLAGPR